MSLLTIAVVMGLGALGGMFGALLGLGGGVFLVPFLTLGFGLPFRQAAGIGLMTVIATSSVVSAQRAGDGTINLRLGIVLEIARLGELGLQINDPSVRYSLDSKPGDYSGLHLLSMMHVGIKMIDPSADTGSGLDREYQLAKAMKK